MVMQSKQFVKINVPANERILKINQYLH